mmetsp:Transcript_108052/g.186474  ORF Transcript_108052/g.186474 Transcript_108052/m.186474 type:complete len:118 (+) Transcript_108052:193-546(+)
MRARPRHSPDLGSGASPKPRPGPNLGSTCSPSPHLDLSPGTRTGLGPERQPCGHVAPPRPQPSEGRKSEGDCICFGALLRETGTGHPTTTPNPGPPRTACGWSPASCTGSARSLLPQ